ncbi:MAG TPA: response regulator transcription factor [Rhizomicrobium sp.]|jgi:two-component system OmpR family response regulator|nr:response regulator transcription factor [Rhizomicrobium sp.]
MKFLVVEDDKDTAAYILRGLKEHGHAVDLASTGRDGAFLAGSETYDAIILDRMLPGIDGLALVKMLRGMAVKTPVLFLTALGGIDDRVEGLNAGADDYLIKPFAFSELIARINALTRRPPLSESQTVMKIADLEVDLLKRSVRRNGVAIELQPREFKILEFLMRHRGQVVTRTMLLEGVWDFHFDPKTNIVETNMSRLRSKLSRDGGRDLIQTIRGSGYLIE